MSELGRLLGRVSLNTSDPLVYLHTSERSSWTGALLTHMKTSQRDSVEGCWNTIMLSHRLSADDESFYIDERGDRHPEIGSIRILPPYEVIRGGWEGFIETVNLFLDPRQCEAVLGRPLAAGKVYFHAKHTHSDPTLEALLRALLMDSVFNGPKNPAVGNGIIAAIIHRLDETHESVSSPDHYIAHNEPQIRKAKDFIEANISAKLSVDELAIFVGLSTRHFCRSFKSATGSSPYQYITARRLEKAKALILQGDETLQEVAMKTGFVRHGNLSAAFQAAFGITPSQFRNSLS
ncbi:AraC family transcriptional regulator [Methylobacterium sp. E-065]|uniref:AraC family transcriptional regulator n=1 Tax=Methylobacterium sp. E-065 TaxID=2836583 RepID=UPI001FBBCE5F|nr:AraC family transcriptional regulator [Methylobacterium sp. E-065]MCJ2021926.1 AraC family transcriptional regulator [Methylobacterium sp. E-065]